MSEAYAKCPHCQKERQLSGRIMKKHNMWNGTKMVHCPGSGRPPKQPSAVMFRNA